MSRYNVNSSFPNSVDDLIFFQDVDLNHLPESRNHNNYAQNGHYTDAGEYLENTATMDSICASLMNLIQNRIYATQDYLNNIHTGWYAETGEETPFKFGEEPLDPTKKPLWIEM